MKSIVKSLSIALVLIGLSACSITPGMPGLKTDSSRYAKPQTEGVDYKLVVIDAKSLVNQKPFNYAAYIKAKRKKVQSLRAQSASSSAYSKSRSNSAQLIQRATTPVRNSHVANSRAHQRKSHDQHKPPVQRFEGVSASDKKANYQYLLGRGDVLNITVWDHPELSEPGQNGHIIGNDGRFYFPYSGKVNAAGKTVRAIRDELQSKLGSFITKPQVSVSVVTFRSQKAYTAGALIKPSTVMINDTPTTVRDAISRSGNVIPNKYTGYATLTRKNGKSISIDLNRMLKYNDNRQNFIMRDGDRLHVVGHSELDDFNRNLALEIRKEHTFNAIRLQNEIRNLKTTNPLKMKFALERERSVADIKDQIEQEKRLEQAKVFVMGEVYKPGTVNYRVTEGMTLAEAINDSGSFKEETVNPKGIFVVRRGAGDKNIPTVYQLPIASVQSMFYAEQFEIRPRDIVYVTATPSIRWNRVIAQLLPSLAIVNTFRNFK